MLLLDPACLHSTQPREKQLWPCPPLSAAPSPLPSLTTLSASCFWMSCLGPLQPGEKQLSPCLRSHYSLDYLPVLVHTCVCVCVRVRVRARIAGIQTKLLLGASLHARGKLPAARNIGLSLPCLPAARRKLPGSKRCTTDCPRPLTPSPLLPLPLSLVTSAVQLFVGAVFPEALTL